jgi:hypothetical protein
LAIIRAAVRGYIAKWDAWEAADLDTLDKAAIGELWAAPEHARHVLRSLVAHEDRT